MNLPSHSHSKAHSPGRSRAACLAASLVLALFVAAAADAREQSIEWARENIAAGKYSDAVELLQKALSTMEKGSPQRREASLVLVDALRIVGRVKDARDMCGELTAADPKDAEAASLIAELDFDAGNYKEAKSAFDALIAANPNYERAWALRSIVMRTLSDRDGLKQTADHFYDLYQTKKAYFNSEDVKDPLELAYLGLGFQEENAKEAFETGFALAESLAKDRGLRNPEIFWWSARLAHEKYAFAFAAERYDTILKIRPRLPDALAGQAAIVLQTMHKLDDVQKLLKEALAVNPHHIDSHLLAAAVDLEEDRYEDARKHIDAALAVNPNHLHGLAMLAFYHLDMAQPEKYAEAEKRALAVNAKAADFYCDIGQMMENKRGFNTAPDYYKKAIAIDPDHWRGYYGLGMNESRQGAHGEERGKELLLTAFGKNKFNLWALNMIKSLDKIIGDKEQNVPPVYSTVKTKHFILKFYHKEAAIVEPYLAEWAESAYEWQTKKFGFEPQGPLTIELCHSFQDQAARTVGLPNLGALGVCFGKLCTVVSPREGVSREVREGREAARGGGNHPPFNWRKVLEHEFGHVMALQMSEFRVPRWYTEAFSTYLEDDSRIQSDRMMIDAIAKDRLKPIDKMNEYFRGNMLMAYVHGRYVIEYIDKNFGFDAHVRALKLFAKGKKIEEVLPEVTGKTIAELNAGQLAFVKKSFENVRMRPSFDQATLVQLDLAAKSALATAQDIANFAIAQATGKRYDAAADLAGKALAKDAKCVDAINVLAFIAYEKKKFEEAKQLYLKSTAIDAERSFTAWHRLGVIYKKEGKTTKAIEALEAARRSYPRYIGPDNPHHALPGLYEDLEPPALDKALGVWRDAVKINTEDPEAALNGLRLAAKMKDPKSVVEFAMAHIEINPYVVEVHRLAGQAYEELKDFPHAAREYGVATALDEKDVECWTGLARARKAMGDKPGALKAAQGALDVDGTHAEAKKLRDEMK